MSKDILINNNPHEEYIIDADLEVIICTVINNRNKKFACVQISKEILNSSRLLALTISNLIDSIESKGYTLDKALLLYGYKIYKVDVNKLIDIKLETELIREITNLEIMVNKVDMYEFMEGQ